MFKWQLLTGFVLAASVLQAEEVIENGDFSKARIHWKIEGKSEMTPETPALLDVTLSARKWTKIEQEIKLSNDSTTLKIKVELQASADFKAEDKSREYSDVDFAMGGQYGWTALVFPKADCLIIIENEGSWEYRPIKLKPGEWQTIQTDCKKIKTKKSYLTLAFPPGTGKVTLRSISVDMTKTP